METEQILNRFLTVQILVFFFCSVSLAIENTSLKKTNFIDPSAKGNTNISGNSFSVCTNGSHSCLCGRNAKTITQIIAPCKVTSDSGSCEANKKMGGFYACCVCIQN